MIVRLSHVHHVVSNMQETLQVYENVWGLKPARLVQFPAEGVTNALLPIGENYIIVQEPSDPQGVLGKHIAKHGEGLRSVCLLSNDLDGEMRSLKAKGVGFVERTPTASSPFRAIWVNPSQTKGLVVMLAEDPEIRDFMKKSY